MGSFERAQGLVRTRRTSLFVAYLFYCLPGTWAAIWIATTHALSAAGNVAGLVAWIGGLLALAFWWSRSWRKRRGRVTADEHGVYVEGRLVAARKAMKNAYVLHDGERMYLRLVRPVGAMPRPVDIEIADEAEGQRILTALRLDAQSSVAEYNFTAGKARGDARKLFGIFGAFTVAMVASIVLFVMGNLKHYGHPMVLWPIALALYIAGSGGAIGALRARNVRVSVGADGVHLRQWLGKPRFISFRDLEDVSIDGKDISLKLANGETVFVHHLGEGRKELAQDREREGAGLVARIRQALDAHRAAPVTGAQALTRGGRSATEWVAQARALREDAASYRAPTIPDDQLWRIVEDAAALPAERAGAALALRTGLDDIGKKRLRVAAEACAESRLRVVLQNATSDDDAALVAALEPLADEAPARRMAL